MCLSLLLSITKKDLTRSLISREKKTKPNNKRQISLSYWDLSLFWSCIFRQSVRDSNRLWSFSEVNPKSPCFLVWPSSKLSVISIIHKQSLTQGPTLQCPALAASALVTRQSRYFESTYNKYSEVFTWVLENALIAWWFICWVYGFVF